MPQTRPAPIEFRGYTNRQESSVLKLQDDTTQAGSPPAGASIGDAWMVDTWGGGYNDGDLVELTSTGPDVWTVIVPNSGGFVPINTKAIVKGIVGGATAAGSFTGHEADEAIADGAGGWAFTNQVDSWTTLISGTGSVFENQGWTFMTDRMVKTIGLVPAHNDTTGLQGGSALERYHLTLAQKENVVNAATYVYHATYPYWKQDSWLPGHAFIDGAVGNATASTGAFATLQQAYDALNASETAGSELKFIMADGTYADAANFGTARPVTIEAVTKNAAKVSGALTFGAHAATIMKSVIKGVYLNAGAITLNDGRDLEIIDGTIYNNAIGWNPTGGVGGYLRFINSRVYNPVLTEQAGWTAGSYKMEIIGGSVYYDTNVAVAFNSTHIWYLFICIGSSSEIQGLSTVRVRTNSLFNLNNGSVGVNFENCSFVQRGTTQAWFANAGSSSLVGINTEFKQFITSLDYVTLGAFSLIEGELTFVGDLPPVIANTATMMWHNPVSKSSATYVYHATYPYWKRDSWKPGSALVDSTGDATASTGSFGKIDDAIAALDATETAGTSLYIEIAKATHTLTTNPLVLPSGRDIYIRAKQVDKRSYGGDDATYIVGGFTVPNNDSAGVTKFLALEGFGLSGNINLNSRSSLKMFNIYFDGIINRTHGTNGCSVQGERVNTADGMFQIVDADVGTGKVKFIDSLLSLGLTAFQFKGAVASYFTNVIFDCFASGTKYLFDFNNAAASVTFRNCIFTPYSTGTLYVATNSGSGTLQFICCRAEIASIGVFNVSANASSGSLTIISSGIPAGMFVGLVWQDTRTKEILVWDGTYWCVGGLVRVENSIAVPVAPASEVDLGWDVPAGFPVVKRSIRILKNLTGASGCTKLGFGTKSAGDPDKHGLTADLLANTTDQSVNTVFNDGAGDDLGLTACDDVGVATGTIAGSNANDVRTMVWMQKPVTLSS